MVDCGIRLKHILETRYTDCTNEKPALHLAVIRNDLEVLKLIIECGTDINILDKHGRTPIAYVLETSQLKILDLLLAAGSNIYKLDELGMMQFSMAFRSGHKNVIKKYFDYNINLNKTDSNGQTAIHYLMDNHCHDTEYYSKKLNFYDDVEDLSGQTPLLLAIKNKNLDWINSLLNAGIYVDYVFESQYTPFNDTVRYFCDDPSKQFEGEHNNEFTLECIKLLLARVTEVNKILCGSYTFLKLAYDLMDIIAIGALLRKLAIIEISGSSIVEINRKIIDQYHSLKSYYSTVKAELIRMMEFKIDKKVSYFNILAEENVYMLAKNFRSLEFQKDFDENLIEFRNYHNALKRKYILGTRRADEISKKKKCCVKFFI